MALHSLPMQPPMRAMCLGSTSVLCGRKRPQGEWPARADAVEQNFPLHMLPPLSATASAKEVQDRIVGEIAKDLTNHPVPEIEKVISAS